MKIVYIYEAIAHVGGIERIFADKMNYLANKGYDVYLITAIQGQHPFSFPLSPAITHIDLDARYHLQYQYRHLKKLWVKLKIDYLFQKRIKEQIKLIDPDIICCTTYYKANVVCKLRCRAKKIIESHNAKSFTRINDGALRGAISKIYNALNVALMMRTIEKKCDILVTLTQGDAKEWKCGKKIRVIPNLFSQMPTSKSNYESQRVIGVGRLEYQKGFDYLIDAWKIVNQRYPNWNLDIYGRGALYNTLIQQISKNSLAHVIRINNPTPNIYNEYANSSIFVLSSRFEGFGLVLIEAMSCGLACISFDCPYGPSDIISHKRNGLLVSNGDIQGLANSICELIKDKTLRKEYGESALKDIECFSPEKIMAQWECLFHELITKEKI